MLWRSIQLLPIEIETDCKVPTVEKDSTMPKLSLIIWSDAFSPWMPSGSTDSSIVFHLNKLQMPRLLVGVIGKTWPVLSHTFPLNLGGLDFQKTWYRQSRSNRQLQKVRLDGRERINYDWYRLPIKTKYHRLSSLTLTNITVRTGARERII